MDIRKVYLHTGVYMTVGIHSIRYTQDANVQRIARYKHVYFSLCCGRLLDLGLLTRRYGMSNHKHGRDVDYVAVGSLCRV